MKHPIDSTEHLEDATKWALDFAFKLLQAQEDVELVGMHDPPSCYPAMLKPATLTLTLEGLQASSTWRCRAVVGKLPKADPSHVAFGTNGS